MKFQEEIFTDLQDEVYDLLQIHYKEVAHYLDIPLEPDWETYKKLESIGNLATYTVRDFSNTLIGYSVFFLRHNIHYKSSYQAVQDIIYVDPNYRKSGIGSELIEYCDQMLADKGVQVVYHHVKQSKNFGPKILEPQGYELIDLIYGKRLDKRG